MELTTGNRWGMMELTSGSGSEMMELTFGSGWVEEEDCPQKSPAPFLLQAERKNR